jgi:hypothetical protein
MEQSPYREADSSVDVQEIPSTLWNAKVLYCIDIETCPYPEPD